MIRLRSQLLAITCCDRCGREGYTVALREHGTVNGGFDLARLPAVFKAQEEFVDRSMLPDADGKWVCPGRSGKL